MTPKFAATQDHLDIEDIRDNLIILKGGAVACVLQTTAINFDLLSEGEQDAMIGAYSSLLNSLAFTLQVVILSKRMDISQYLERLRLLEQRQPNDHLRRRIGNYIEFVGNLISKKEVLNKRFYLAIRYGEFTPPSPTSFIDRLLGREVEPRSFSKERVLKELLVSRHGRLLRDRQRQRGSRLKFGRLLRLVVARRGAHRGNDL